MLVDIKSLCQTSHLSRRSRLLLCPSYLHLLIQWIELKINKYKCYPWGKKLPSMYMNSAKNVSPSKNKLNEQSLSFQKELKRKRKLVCVDDGLALPSPTERRREASRCSCSVIERIAPSSQRLVRLKWRVVVMWLSGRKARAAARSSSPPCVTGVSLH